MFLPHSLACIDMCSRCARGTGLYWFSNDVPPAQSQVYYYCVQLDHILLERIVPYDVGAREQNYAGLGAALFPFTFYPYKMSVCSATSSVKMSVI